MVDYSRHLLLKGNLALPQGHTSLYFLLISWLEATSSHIFYWGLRWQSCHSPLTPTYHYISITSKIYFSFEAHLAQLIRLCFGTMILEWVTWERGMMEGLSWRLMPSSMLSLQWLSSDYLSPSGVLHFKSCHRPGDFLMLATITTTLEPWLYLRPSQDVALHFRDLKFWCIKSLTVNSWLPSSLTLLLLPYLLPDIPDTTRPLTSLFSPKSSLPLIFPFLSYSAQTL